MLVDDRLTRSADPAEDACGRTFGFVTDDSGLIAEYLLQSESGGIPWCPVQVLIPRDRPTSAWNRGEGGFSTAGLFVECNAEEPGWQIAFYGVGSVEEIHSIVATISDQVQEHVGTAVEALDVSPGTASIIGFD